VLNYIKEIKNRFILISVLSFSCFVMFYAYKEIILFLILKIFQKSFFNVSNFNFLSTNITEIFLTYINLIKFFSLQVISGFCLYHFFIFFAPALSQIEYNHCKSFFFNFVGAWFLAVILNNYFMVPLSWKFFYSFQATHYYNFLDFYFEAKISEYLNFYMVIHYVCVFYVESLTIILTFFSFVINKIFFIKTYRKIYYYIFFIFSTLVSPPEIFSQLLFFLLISVLFEVFVFIQIFKLAN
jgi:sec-independent protein translocase protein TatC